MLTNYLKIALRNVLKNRTFSGINVVGLAVGLGCGLVIFILLAFLLSYDTYHPNASRIYRVVSELRHGDVVPLQGTPRPLGDVLRQDYPFLEQVVRIERLYGRVVGVPKTDGGFIRKFDESHAIAYVEPSYFDVFAADWLSGNAKTALTAPNTVVLTEKYARKYFGTTPAMGQILRLDNQTNLTVTGIIKDHPANTNLDFDAFLSYASLAASSPEARLSLQNWDRIDNASQCYVLLRPEIPAERLASALIAIRQKHYTPTQAKTRSFHVQPLEEINFSPEYGGHAPKPILYALGIVGVLLVLAACINFMNITTARALKRAREVGIRKAVGSTQNQLVGQFITETTLLVLLAMCLALLLTYLALPRLNETLAVLNANLSLTNLLHPKLLALLGLLIGIVVVLSGYYPARVLARFNPISSLRSRQPAQGGGLLVRRGLVVIQFFITQLFLIGVLVIMTQVHYMQRVNLGFNQEAILTVPVPTSDPIKQEALRNRLREVLDVEAVAFGSQGPVSSPGDQGTEPFTYDTRTEPEKFHVRTRTGDSNYVPLFGINLVAGRNFFNYEKGSDDVLVNETLVRQLGLKAPGDVLGKRLRINDRNKRIVGIIGDFYLNGLRTAVPPTILINDSAAYHMAAVKVRPEKLVATVKSIEAVWNGLFPEQVFTYRFMDEEVAQLYLGEHIVLGLAQLFSLIAIVIGCLGLYGLVAFVAESKTKEIGIRKVLGASFGQLLWLFGREFSLLTLLGFAVAAPLGWLLMKGWLQGYSHRIELSGWVFVLAFILSCMITLLTVGFQSVKAVLMNPVKSLRSE